LSRRLSVCLLMVATLLICSCGQSSASGTDWSQQTSASSGGGMDALVAAARQEGTLNLSAAPSSWAGYDALVSGFEAKFGVHANVMVSGDSAEQIAAAASRSPSPGGVPDVFALDEDVAAAHTAMFAPYLVFYWLEIPGAFKDAQAYWYGDCGGYTSIGYDSSNLPPVTSVTDLLQPAFKGAVGLDGNPTQGGGALAAVLLASVVDGGSVDDIGPGVQLFHQLAAAGNLVSRTSMSSGGVTLDWDYVERGIAAGFAGWKFVVPPDALGAYYAEAVNRNAPHPAAARLWEEYLFSDTGQNLCLQKGARPARMEAMTAEGVLDQAAATALGPVPASAALLTPTQMAAARAYLAAHWAAAVAG
jgi:putative spermidine/putrescine transport system substrate-binding protein